MDVIEIAVVLRDFASRNMDALTNRLERNVEQMEKRAGLMSKGFDSGGKSIQGFEGDVRVLQGRLQQLENGFAREARAIERSTSATARAKDKNRDFESSLRSMARSANITANQFEKAGMVEFAEELRDIGDQLEHESKRIDSSTQTLGQTFRKNRLQAGGLISDLKSWETELHNTRRSLFDHAKSMDQEAAAVGRLDSRFQRLTSTVERWGRAALAQDRGLAGFGKQLQKNLTNLDTTIDRQERRFILFLSIIPTVATALYGLAGIVTSLTAGIYALASALGVMLGALVAIPALVAAVGGAFAAVLTSVRGEISGIIQGVQLLEQSTSKAQARANRASARAASGETIPKATDAGIAAAEEDLRKHRLLGISDVQQAEIRLAEVRKDNARQEADQVRQINRLKRDTLQEVVRAEQRLNDLLNQEDDTRTQLVNNLAIARANADNAIGAERPTALGNLKDAQAQLAQFDRARQVELRNARQDVADAKTRRRESLADANRQLKQLREQNQRQILDAEQQIVASARAAQQANAQTGADVLKTNAAWLRLSATQKAIVREIVQIRKAWHELTGPGRREIDAFVQDLLGKLRGGLPTLAGIVNQYDNTLAGIGRKFLATFDDKTFTARLRRIFGQGTVTLDRMGTAAIHLGKAVAIITDAGRPLIDWMTRMIRNFGLWAEKAALAGEKSGGLTRFFERARTVMTEVGHILENIFITLKNISDIAFPFGNSMLKSFEAWTKHLRDITSQPIAPIDVKGAGSGSGIGSARPTIAKYFKDNLPVFREFAKLLKDIVVTIFQIGNAATKGGNQSGLFKFLDSIDRKLPAIRDNIIEMAHRFGPILGNFLKEAGKALGTLAAANGPLAHFIKFVTILLKAFNSLPGPIKSFTADFIFFGRLFGVTGALTKVWGELLKRTFTSVFARVGPLTMRIFADQFQKVFIGSKLYAAGIRDAFIKMAARIKAINLAGAISGISAGSKALAANFVAAMRTMGLALLAFGRMMWAFVLENPIVLAIAAAIVIIVLIITHWKQFKEIVGAIWSWMKTAAADAFGFVSKIIGQTWDFIVKKTKGFVSAAKKAFSGFLEIFTHPLKWLQDHWKDLLIAVISGPFAPIMLLLRVFFPKFTQAMVDGFTSWLDKVGQFFANIGRWLYDHILKPILNFFGISSPSTVMFQVGVDIMMGLLKGVMSVGDKLLDFFAGLGKKIVDKIWGGIKKAGHLIGKAGHKLKGIGGDVAHALDPTNWAEGGIQKAVPGGVVRYAEAGHDEAFISLDPRKKRRSAMIVAEVMRRLNIRPVDFQDGGIAIGGRRPVSRDEWLERLLAAAVAKQGARTIPANQNRQPEARPADPSLVHPMSAQQLANVRAQVIANAAMKAVAPDIEASRRATAPHWRKGIREILSLYLGPHIARLITGGHTSVGGVGLDAAMLLPWGRIGHGIQVLRAIDEASAAGRIAEAAAKGSAAARAAKAGGRSAELFVPTEKQIRDRPYMQFAAFWADPSSRRIIFGEPGSSHWELLDKAHMQGISPDELGEKWVQGRLRFGNGKIDSVAIYGRMQYSPFPQITDAQREAMRTVALRQAVKTYARPVAKVAARKAAEIKLSGNALGSIVQYTSGMGSWINAVLRGVKTPEELDYIMREHYDDIVKGLDEAMKAQPRLAADMHVFRSDPAFADLKRGDVYREPAFASTTKIDENEAARRFGRVIAEVIVRKGSRVLDLRNAVGVKGTLVEGRLGHAGEHEVILPRGGSFKVISATPTEEGILGQSKKLVLEWIPPVREYAAGGIFKAVAGGLMRIAEGGYDEAVISFDPRHRARSVEILREVVRRLGLQQGTLGDLLTSWNSARAGALYSPAMARVPSFSSGGIAMHGPTVDKKIVEKRLEQNFNIRMDDEQDWDYAMRLAAIHALGSW